MEYQEHQIAEGIKAVKYKVGDVDESGKWVGHSHIFYLRDDLPVATSTESAYDNNVGHHAHAIRMGANKVLVCDPAEHPPHTHTTIKIVED